MKGIVIFHGGGLGERCTSFDVLVKKEYFEEYKWLEESLYKVDCDYVKRFLETNKDYYYVGSQDFLGFCNVDNIRILAKLLIDDFEFRCEFKEVTEQ